MKKFLFSAASALLLAAITLPAGAIWIPEQAYRPGSWGFVGGGRYTVGAKLTWNPVYEIHGQCL